VRIIEELMEIWPNEVCDIYFDPHIDSHYLLYSAVLHNQDHLHSHFFIPPLFD